jgi:ribosomal protein S18
VRKHSFEDVKKFVEREGTTLLSLDYKSNKAKLNFMCPKGHKYSMSFDSFQQGHGCPKCAGNAKPTYKEVKQLVEAGGTKLLSIEYKNSKTKLDLMCPEGHEYPMTFNDFKNSGHRCPLCAGNIKFTFEEVKAFVEIDSTTLRSTEYKNNKTLLNFICPKGHEYSNTLDNFKNKGQRCPKCSAKRTGKKLSLDFSEVKVFVEAAGTTLRFSEYVNNRTPLELVCPKGHEYSATFDNFKYKNSRCPFCSGGSVSKISQVWLDQKDKLHLFPLFREHPLVVNGKKYKVDGFDPLTRTIYEFLGDFWHGNPTRPKNKRLYGQLYKETFKRIAVLEAAGYNVVYIWEKDFREQQEI